MRLARGTLTVLIAAAAVGASGLAAVPASAAPADTRAGCPWVSSHASPGTRAGAVLAQMTLDDKIAMVHGVSGSGYAGEIPANARLCIPALKLEDGPAGVADGMTGVTQLPAPVAAASSWDPALMRRYGSVIGAEQWGKGANVDLGPTVNIVRDPRWGRAFESLGEDPYLAGRLGAADIRGVQSQGVLAQVKHWDVYNQETYRNTPADDVQIDHRTMREIYMPQFEAAVKHGHPASAMCSYSTLNGGYACQNGYIQNTVLKGDWHFRGFITSDWGATHSTAASANGGLDMQMPSGSYFGAPLKAAVQAGTVPTSRLDDMVRRVLTQMFRFHLFTRKQTGTLSSTVTTAAHAAIARTVAEQGAVLLKNAGALPFDTTRPHSIAVIGDSGGSDAMTAGGGSASVTAPYTVTPLQGITKRAGSNVTVGYAQGTVPGGRYPVIGSQYLPGGLSVSYYGNTTLSGDPVATGTATTVDADWQAKPPADGVPGSNWSAKYTGTLVAPTTGDYPVSLTSDDGSRLYVGGKLVIDNWRDQAPTTETATVHLTAGTEVPVEVDYYQAGGGDELHLGWQIPGGRSPIDQAVALAKKSDVAVVFADDFESEGSDLKDITLPGRQNELISAVAAANPDTIVVLNTGSAVELPWASKVKGIIADWYPGQEDGNAIAALLYGDVNPSGHLPVTFPKKLSDVPASTPQRWPGVDGKVRYSEGLRVGYRWYDAQHITPRYPFGAGLSYTTFRFGGLHVSHPHHGQVTARVTVTNTGHRAGAEVAQLYVGDPSSTGEPPKQLKGFAKVHLRPHQTKLVTFHLPARAFAYWNDQAGDWTVAAGRYRLLAGSSSADLPATATVRLPAQHLSP